MIIMIYSLGTLYLGAKVDGMNVGTIGRLLTDLAGEGKMEGKSQKKGLGSAVAIVMVSFPALFQRTQEEGLWLSCRGP